MKINSLLNSVMKEYFQCRSNGRFVDQYNCAQGKYFECIHYQQGLIFISISFQKYVV